MKTFLLGFTSALLVTGLLLTPAKASRPRHAPTMLPPIIQEKTAGKKPSFSSPVYVQDQTVKRDEVIQNWQFTQNPLAPVTVCGDTYGEQLVSITQFTTGPFASQTRLMYSGTYVLYTSGPAGTVTYARVDIRPVLTGIYTEVFIKDQYNVAYGNLYSNSWVLGGTFYVESIIAIPANTTIQIYLYGNGSSEGGAGRMELQNVVLNVQARYDD